MGNTKSVLSEKEKEKKQESQLCFYSFVETNPRHLIQNSNSLWIRRKIPLYCYRPAKLIILSSLYFTSNGTRTLRGDNLLFLCYASLFVVWESRAYRYRHAQKASISRVEIMTDVLRYPWVSRDIPLVTVSCFCLASDSDGCGHRCAGWLTTMTRIIRIQHK